MLEPLVSIIVVNWNGLMHLKKSIPSLMRIDYKNFEIILVDNNSSDGSLEYVYKNHPPVKVVKNQENLGFAEANNVGYKHTKGDLILFANNDIEVEPDFLGKLVEELLSDSKLGGVQPKIILMDKKDKLDSVGAFLTNTGFLFHYGIYKSENDIKYNKKIEIYSAKGAGMLFKREVIEKTGLFDKDFFAYFEETDFCHRVWLAGYTIRYIPEARMYHLMGGTSIKIDSAFIQFHSFKNRINSFLKNLEPKNMIKIVFRHLLVINIVSVCCFFSGKFNMAFAIHKAIFWNILNISKTMEKRKYIQENIRVLQDSEIEETIFKAPRWIYYYYLFASKVDQYNDPLLVSRG